VGDELVDLCPGRRGKHRDEKTRQRASRDQIRIHGLIPFSIQCEIWDIPLTLSTLSGIQPCVTATLDVSALLFASFPISTLQRPSTATGAHATAALHFRPCPGRSRRIGRFLHFEQHATQKRQQLFRGTATIAVHNRIFFVSIRFNVVLLLLFQPETIGSAGGLTASRLTSPWNAYGLLRLTWLISSASACRR
jgi:hypothetical protein